MWRFGHACLPRRRDGARRRSVSGSVVWWGKKCKYHRLKALELLKDQDLKTSASFDWKSGEWIRLRFQIRKLKEGEWKVEGKAWPQSAIEPKEWAISFDE